MRIPDHARADAPDAGDLSPLTDEEYDEEYLAVFDQLSARFVMLVGAYRVGMVVARDDEQRRQLEELQRLLGVAGDAD